MKIYGFSSRNLVGLIRNLLPVAYGIFSQFAGLAAYLYCIYYLVDTTSSDFLAHYFIINSVAVFVAQIATAGIDGKLYYNSMTGKMGRQNFKANGLAYLPLAVSFSLIFILFSHYIFPFEVSLQVFLYLLTTILLQPLLANLIAFSLAEKRFYLSNFLVVAPWGIRALILLCLSFLSLTSQLASKPEFIYVVFSLSTVLSLLIGLVYCSRRYQYVLPRLTQLLCFILPAHSSASRLNSVYLIANISSLIPYAIAPYVLLVLTSDTRSVSVLGTFLSLLSVFVTSVRVYNTRFALPSLFVFAQTRQMRRIPGLIIAYSFPVYLIYTILFILAFLPLRSIVLDFLGPIGDSVFNLYPYFVGLVFLSIFSVPANSLLSGGRFLLPWVSVKLISCVIVLLALFALVPGTGLSGSLQALVFFAIVEALGYIKIFARCSGVSNL